LPPAVGAMDAPERAAWFRTGALEWIAADPGHFVGQAARKFRAFWAPALPEWSLPHKVLKTAYFLPLYALAMVGLARSRRNVAFAALTVLGIASFMLTSLVTFVDYDQRYRLPSELFIIPLGAVGLVSLTRAIASWSPAAAAWASNPGRGVQTG
jgi:hypothetical protein